MARLIVCTLLVASVTAAAPPDRTPANLEASLRDLLLQSLPAPLFEDTKHWGRKARGPLGKQKNDGRWWKLRIDPRDPARTLVVLVRDVKQVGTGRKTFNLRVSMPAVIQFEQQVWKYGLRLYSGSTRARAWLHLVLVCEVTTRLENKGGLLPDLVVRMRVLKSDFRYNDLVVEHTAGVGGDGARLLGEGVIETVKRIRPSLERNLFEKANAAILKAGDSRDVRISLMGVSVDKNK